MRFLSIYKTVETNVFPTPEEFERMGAEAIESAKRFLSVVGGGECELRQICETPDQFSRTSPDGQPANASK